MSPISQDRFTSYAILTTRCRRLPWQRWTLTRRPDVVWEQGVKLSAEVRGAVDQVPSPRPLGPSQGQANKRGRANDPEQCQAGWTTAMSRQAHSHRRRRSPKPGLATNTMSSCLYFLNFVNKPSWPWSLIREENALFHSLQRHNSSLILSHDS